MINMPKSMVNVSYQGQCLILLLNVEVLWTSQPIMIMLSWSVNPTTLFLVNQYLCIFFSKTVTTALLESAEGRE